MHCTSFPSGYIHYSFTLKAECLKKERDSQSEFYIAYNHAWLFDIYNFMAQFVAKNICVIYRQSNLL